MKKTVGQLLQEQSIITAEQLAECKEAAATSNQTVEQCLVEKKYASAEDVAKAQATYVNWPFVNKITDVMADPMLLAKVPLRFLRDNVVIPVKMEDKIFILTAHPLEFQPLDELNLLFDNQATYAVSPDKTIIDAINRYYPIEGAKQMIAEFEREEDKELDGALDFGDIEETDIVAMAAEAPIIKLVNNILYQAVKRDASDIHIEPFEKEIQVRYRIDGVLYTVMTPPKRIQNALISRIKIMANLDIAEKRVPQDGRIDIKVAGKPWDIRVSILPVAYGERIVMRLLDKAKTFGKLEKLGFSQRDFKLITQSISKPNGIIYITGPTGSGKTSTLYSILSELNHPDVNIITVEDPVEYQMNGIGQVQVRPKVGLTFAAALRSILRQDPDIIMIGETRDFETAQIAIQSALTGHLVLSTLHTNSAPSTITRLLDMGLEPFLISSSLILAMAQRLVRRLCEHCKKPYRPSLDVLKSIGLDEAQAKNITFYEPIGCQECNMTGYRGRLAIFELMEVTSGIVKLIMERADTSEIQKQALKDGMTLLVQDGLRKIKEGLTTIEEVLSAAAIEQEVVE